MATACRSVIQPPSAPAVSSQAFRFVGTTRPRAAEAERGSGVEAFGGVVVIMGGSSYCHF